MKCSANASSASMASTSAERSSAPRDSRARRVAFCSALRWYQPNTPTALISEPGLSVASRYCWEVKSAVGRASRKWALLAPARVAYSGSACCRRTSDTRSALIRSARMASLSSCRRMSSIGLMRSSPGLAGGASAIRDRSSFSCAATSATERIQSASRTVLEHLLARAGMVPADAPTSRPSRCIRARRPASVSAPAAHSLCSCPSRASAQSRSKAARCAGSSASTASTAMSRCSG